MSYAEMYKGSDTHNLKNFQAGIAASKKNENESQSNESLKRPTRIKTDSEIIKKKDKNPSPLKQSTNNEITKEVFDKMPAAEKIQLMIRKDVNIIGKPGDSKKKKPNRSMQTAMLAKLMKYIDDKIASVVKNERSEVYQKNRALRAEMERKSLLIFGTKDMSEKVVQEHQKKMQVVKKDEEEGKASCIEYLFIDIDASFYQTFDVSLIVVIIYSCFTSAYWAAFENEASEKGIIIDLIEWIVTFFFAVDILFNFMIPIKVNDGTMIRKHLPIAQKYVTRGSFIPDILATFPFQYFGSKKSVLLKLIRMIRLPRILKLFNKQRFQNIVSFITRNQSRQSQVKNQMLVKTIYTLFKMIMITIVVAYFGGCLFYFAGDQLNTEENKASNSTFIEGYQLNGKSNAFKCITVTYFMMTSLTSIGYGDLSPQSNLEKVIGVLIFFSSQAFVAYVLKSFRTIMDDMEEVSQFSNKERSLEAGEIELQSWLHTLIRYRDNKPFPAILETQIFTHYRYSCLSDRHEAVRHKEFMRLLPTDTRKAVIVNYVFDDFVYDYRNLLRPQDPFNNDIIEMLCMGLMPRYFSSEVNANVIYEEGQEVQEMYFIQSGEVGAGFQIVKTHVFDNSIASKQYNLPYTLQAKRSFGEYFIVFSKKAEFCYLAKTDVNAWALSKKYIMQRVFGKFPEENFAAFQQRALLNYTQQKTSIINHKESSIKKANTHNEYFSIKIDHSKEIAKEPGHYIFIKEDPLDLVRERIDIIPSHIGHLATELGVFCKSVDEELTDFNKKLEYLNEAKREIRWLKQQNLFNDVQKEHAREALIKIKSNVERERSLRDLEQRTPKTVAKK